MSRAELSTAQRAEARAHGLADADVDRQLAFYADPPPPSRLTRACTVGDGIRAIDAADSERMAARYSSALGDRIPLAFVPASGAASRMFKAPLAVFHSSEPVTLASLERDGAKSSDAREVLEALQNLERFAFYEALFALGTRAGIDIGHLGSASDIRPVLGLLVGKNGLDFGNVPKGLLPFHRYGERSRTAFEEHLVEAAAYARDRSAVCRLHFTVSAEHEEAFRALAARVVPEYEKRFAVHYEIAFSTQHASTDALAVGADDRPFVLGDGTLLFRPGGHGSLIANLGEIDADLVFVKNIDNVVPDHAKDETLKWKRALGALLLDLRAAVFEALDALDAGAPNAVERAAALLRDELGIDSGRDPLDARCAIDLLDRPLRVCGMVRNTGDPGGGPFWVRLDGRETRQIVETSQVDTKDAAQNRILESATHFNPVDLVCSFRDRRGARYDLGRYIDQEAVFIVEKSKDGRALKSLERPGLWNGAMARWNTVFVEVPASTFHPVKTLNNLLAPAHQPGA